MMHSDREHVDSDVIALMALGEPGIAAADVRHVASCAECAAEMRELRRVVELGRSSADARSTRDPMPRDEVWAGISATLGLTAGIAPASFGAGDEGISTPTAHSSATTPALHAASLHAGSAPPLLTVPTRAPASDVRVHTPPPAARVASESGMGAEDRARRRWLPPLLGAAAIVMIVGGVAGGLALRQPPPAVVLAQAQLDALPDWDGATGQAAVEIDDEGGRSVVVALQDGTPDDGYREVWLISDDLTSLVSLGVLEGDDGRFVIPAGIDLDAFPVVDVSDEPLDGDPTHSGNSIVRGTLES